MNLKTYGYHGYGQNTSQKKSAPQMYERELPFENPLFQRLYDITCIKQWKIRQQEIVSNYWRLTTAHYPITVQYFYGNTNETIYTVI